jgi:DNA polymerase-1
MEKNDLLKILDKVSKDNDGPTFKKHDRILVIDGLNLFLRNFAVVNFVNKQGVHIGGLSGFLRSLGFLIGQINPTEVYIVFDGIDSSINRKNLLPEYKSNRNVGLMNKNIFKNKEDESNATVDQITRLIHYLKCLPVKVISLDKVEADDIISHLSTHLSKTQNSKVYIVSSDKDFLQIVDNNITVYRPIEKEFFTPEKVKEKFGCSPKNFILYKTLLGDESDKVPGVKGLGKGKIYKLFPDLQNHSLILDDLFEICEAKYKDHIIYSRILFDKENILKHYTLMNLSSPLVDEEEKQIIQDLVLTNAPKLQPNPFLQLYQEDGLGNLFKDVSFWLRNNFQTLNSFNK